jgi:hypothetical protein
MFGDVEYLRDGARGMKIFFSLLFYPNRLLKTFSRRIATATELCKGERLKLALSSLMFQ